MGKRHFCPSTWLRGDGNGKIVVVSIMAKEPNPELEVAAPLDDAPQKPKSNRMYILLGMVLLILIQTTIMFFLLPGPGKIRSELDGIDDPTLEGGFSPEVPIESKPIETVERPVTNPLREDATKFNIQQTNPEVPGGQLMFSASVVLVIAKGDSASFDKLYPIKANRIWQECEIILRNSTLSDRKEATLGTIRRKLLAKINEVLDENKNYVRDVLCTDVTEGET